MTTNIPAKLLETAQKWTKSPYDTDTQAAVKQMIENNPTELIECFYKTLEFGTGGLRGIMGVGSNRMNKYTVGVATQGLANYLNKRYVGAEQIKAVIAYDCRHNNTLFSQLTADVLSANGIFVYQFDALRPTPELSFAIRHLKAQSGVVITASHNPKEYSGYKVYGEDGGQLISPYDKAVMEEVNNIKSIKEVKFKGNPNLQATIDSDMDAAYIAAVKSLSLQTQNNAKHANIPIVYTPIHGTGVHLVPMALKAFGFNNIHHVPEQDLIDGDFPSVHSPNPEEAAALSMAIAKAETINADLVMATDPDSDRVGIAVRNTDNEFELLNGNQTAALLSYYLFKMWKDKGKINGKQFMVKTIVTSEILIDIANDFDIQSYDVLTGFKYIADIIKRQEGKSEFICGGEESYGFLIGDQVRDKDAVSACAMIAEVAAWATEQGETLYSLLQSIYQKYGFYYESLHSVEKKGKAGAEEIQNMMKTYREQPPKTINGSPIVMIKDYESRVCKDIQTGKEYPIELPKSNVLQFFTADGSKISIRPSGTEAKIKFYFGVKGELTDTSQYKSILQSLQIKIEQLKAAILA